MVHLTYIVIGLIVCFITWGAGFRSGRLETEAFDKPRTLDDLIRFYPHVVGRSFTTTYAYQDGEATTYVAVSSENHRVLHLKLQEKPPNNFIILATQKSNTISLCLSPTKVL